MNKRAIIGIIIAVAIVIGAAVAFSINETGDNGVSDLTGTGKGSEPKQYTITLSENVGIQENPP